MAEEQLLQTRSYFGTVEVITESHDVPRGLTPKYIITVEGELGTFEPHFVQPPRSLFFVSPGEYVIKCCFLGVVAEPVTVMVQVSEVARVKFHFHGRWAEGLPKPPIAVPRAQKQAAAPPPVAATPGYAGPASAFGPTPQPPGTFRETPGSGPQTTYVPPPGSGARPPGTPALPSPGFQSQPAVPHTNFGSGPSSTQYSPAGPATPVTPQAPTTMPIPAGYGSGSTHQISPPPMPGASHLVAPPPPPPGKPQPAPITPPAAAAPVTPAGRTRPWH